MDYERKQDKIRKQSKEFKKRRRQLRNNRSKKDGQCEFREGTVYQSGGALNIDDEILNACNVTANERCNLEQFVSPFCLRRKRTYLFFCPNVEYYFIVYDTETNCGGKKAEIVELSAIAHSTGTLFTKFVLPKNGISEHVSKINKFQVVSTGSKKILRRNGIELSTVSLQECLRSFAEFLKTTATEVQKATSKEVHTVLIGHNGNVFDCPLLVRSLEQCDDIQSHIKKVYFADSLALTKQLLKEKNQALRNTDGTTPKANLRDIYSCLFQTEFCNSHQGLADVQALREVLFQSNLKLTSKDTVNKSNVMKFATLEADVKYLDDSHDRLLTFRNQLYDETEQSVVTKSLAKKLADSGLTMSDLRKLYTSAGPRGIAALLSHPPSSSKGKSPRGTKCAITLQKIVDYLKIAP